MVAMLVRVENVADLLVIEIFIQAVHDDFGARRVHQKQRVFSARLHNVGVVVLEQRHCEDAE